LERSGVNEEVSQSVRKWLTEGVDVREYFTHFKGNFRGKPYESEGPPSAIFLNSTICRKYDAFISGVLKEKIKLGAIRVLGRIGECEMPRVIVPLTIEPTKLR
jgi:hypothetical protein